MSGFVVLEPLLSAVFRDEHSAEEHHPAQIPAPRSTILSRALLTVCRNRKIGKEIGKKCWKPGKFYHSLHSVLLPLLEILQFLNQGAATTSDISQDKTKDSVSLTGLSASNAVHSTLSTWEKVVKFRVPALNGVTLPWLELHRLYGA